MLFNLTLNSGIFLLLLANILAFLGGSFLILFFKLSIVDTQSYIGFKYITQWFKVSCIIKSSPLVQFLSVSRGRCYRITDYILYAVRLSL